MPSDALVLSAVAALPAAVRDSRIISLCDIAIGELREARDLEDVFGILNAAEAFSTYTRKYKAAVEAQNQCKIVVLLAEDRIGRELTAAQERGEVATHGGDRTSKVQGADLELPTLKDIGVSKQRASEYKAIAAAGETAIHKEAAEANAEKRPVSRRKIIEAGKAKKPKKPRAKITRHIPTIAARPPELVQFQNWLRHTASYVRELGAPSAVVACLAEHDMSLPSGEINAIADFIVGLKECIQ